MDQDIASAINRARFPAQAPAHSRSINAGRRGNGTITVITHQTATPEIALHYCKIIIMAAGTLGKGVVDVVENESWERLTIHEVQRQQSMGRVTEGLWMMREALDVEN